MVEPYKDSDMTITISESELIKKFLVDKEGVYKAIIVDACGTSDFCYRAKLIYNAIHDNTNEDDYDAILTSNGCQALQTKGDCVAFYESHRTLFMDWLKSTASGNGSEEAILNIMSLVLYGEPRNKVKAVFIDNEKIDCYADLIAKLLNHIRINLSIDFTRFADEYKKEHEFFDINFNSDANLTLAAKRVLLKSLPEFFVSDAGVVFDADRRPLQVPSNSLEDIIGIIHNAGYQKGRCADNDWDMD
jgi:hypothetical protein